MKEIVLKYCDRSLQILSVSQELHTNFDTKVMAEFKNFSFQSLESAGAESIQTCNKSRSWGPSVHFYLRKYVLSEMPYTCN